MPELPEVEVARRYIEAHALDRKIERLDVHDRRILASVTPAKLKRAVVGSHLTETRRHGKHLFVAISSGPWLHLHLGMTGDLYVSGLPSALGDDRPPRFVRVEIGFENGAKFLFDDARLFGRVGLIGSPEQHTRRLGIDALDAGFHPVAFRDLLQKRRGGIKALLMNQRVVAGLGNLYVDEALYQSSIHPLARVDRLSGGEMEQLAKNIRRVLNVAIDRIERGREHPRKNLIMRREEGETCGICRGRIQRATIAGRSTYFCPRHQALRY